MCIAFPGRVVALEATGAIVDIDGRRRGASLLLVPDVAVGDWVVVAAGTVVERLDERDARELQALVRAATSPEGPAAGSPSDVPGGDRHVPVA